MRLAADDGSVRGGAARDASAAAGRGGRAGAARCLIYTIRNY